MIAFLSKYKFVILYFLSLGIAFSSGWKVHEYYVGYQQNLEKIVQESIDKGITDYQKKQAQGLEDTKKLLSGVKTNTILKENTNTIINQPIYYERCMNQPGVDILEVYKKESALLINPPKDKSK